MASALECMVITEEAGLRLVLIKEDLVGVDLEGVEVILEEGVHLEPEVVILEEGVRLEPEGVNLEEGVHLEEGEVLEQEEVLCCQHLRTMVCTTFIKF